jgi:multiple sugar transport system permease protein
MTAVAQPYAKAQAVTAPSGERSHQIRTWSVRILVYAILIIVALFMLFPFVYMVFTSLKSASDVFHSPPRLLPYSPVTVMYNGEETPLFEIEIDGVTYQMVDTGETVRFGNFAEEADINAATPRDSVITVSAPMENATGTGEVITIDGEEFDVYTVPMSDGSTRELVLAYPGGKSLFVDPTDPSITAYAVARETPLVEVVDFQWGNYNAVLTLNNLNRALINTMLVTVAVTVGQVTTALLGGYAFSRMRFRGQNAVFLVYLGTIMIPFVVLIIPLYQIMVIIGWQDTLGALIFPWIFTAYGTFLMRQFFISIPKELEEAAFLDGLSRLGILWKIFVPLSLPAIATQAIITFLYAWNSFVWPLIIIGDSPIENHVLTLSLITLRNAYASEPNLVLTGAAIAILPPLVVFILAQRYFIEGIANTGLK